MKIFIDDNILVKDRLCAEYNFISPYSATAAEKIKSAGMRITDKADGADAVLSSKIIDNMICIKPTYGTVSRFGLAAGASSMEQIGVCANNLDDGFTVLSAIAGHDKNDGTSYPAEKYGYSPYSGGLKKVNFSELNFKYADCLAEIYLIISAAELSANIARFDGIKFGHRTENFKNINELIINSRSESFNLETKLNALMGAYVLSKEQFDKYYLKAAKIRRLVKQELDLIFKQADILTHTLCDEAVALANLTGCPAVIIDGEILTAREFDEDKLYAAGKELLI